MNETHLFSSPQRLNSLGFVISVFKTFVKIIRQFFFFIAYVIYKSRDSFNLAYFWFALIALIIITVIIAFVNFRTYTYYIDDENEEFIVKKGVFNKSKIVIKFNNILQVNITQNIIQKALSLYGVTLDTAGSDKVEVDLYALDGYHATELKKFLLSKINSQNEYSTASDEEILSTSQTSDNSILKLLPKNILLVSLFSNYRQGLALFIAFLGTMFQNFKDAIDTFELSDEEIGTEDIKQFDFASLMPVVGTIVIGLLAIPFLINLFRYYFKYYDFSIVKNPSGNFSMQYGLTKKVNTIFNRDKVQFIAFKQNQLLKKIGIGILSLKQLVTDAAKEDKSSVVMPGLLLSDKDEVYRLAFSDKVFEEYNHLKPKIGLFISRCIKGLIFVVVIFLILFFIDIDNKIIFLLILIFGTSLGLYNYLYYINYSLLYNDNFVIKKYGVWNEKEVIIPINKLQGVEISQSFFQQRASSANISLYTAAGNINLQFFPQQQVYSLSNYLIYMIEK